jgi:uncharacterized membrane protein YecN with MAPEG domain
MQALTDKRREGLFSAVFIGFVFILVAVVYFINLSNNIWNSFVNFIGSFVLSQVPGTGFSLPAPANPIAYTVIYNAAFEFCLGMGILEIAILALRIVMHSPLSRKAETIENLVFWLGTGYLVITYLVNMTIMSEWFVFWAGIILIFGLALVARAFVLLAGRHS